ncbi:MAG TPA: rhomboid family intramembrane serine protease [Steroidobacteraceae bacterium]|jgi:membrane associated rhomboid family serine protease
MLPTLLEIYRSTRSSDCEERAFVLTAVGVPSVIERDGLDYVIRVEADHAALALSHLERYAVESRPLPPPPPPPPLDPFAWVGCVFYVVVLLIVGYSVAGGLWRLDAFDAGALNAARMQAGEWWRAWTALTLHVDAGHLATNLGAGVWFGYLAGRQLGSGVAWLLVLLGAGFANLLEGLWGPPSHRAVGASTAVFAALGLLAAHAWRSRFSLRQRWVRRWGPLVAGVILLGWLGSGGGDPSDPLGPTATDRSIDIVGHLGGFVMGALLGVLAALPATKRWLARVPQWLAGGAALLIVAVTWVFALQS